MKDLITRLLTIILTVGIMAIIIIIAIIAWEELNNLNDDDSYETEEFISTISEDVPDTVENIEVPQILQSEVADVNFGSNAQQQVNYDNVEIDRFLYNQLEEPEKYIYKAFEDKIFKSFSNLDSTVTIERTDK